MRKSILILLLLAPFFALSQKPATFKIRKGFRIVLAGKYTDKDSLPLAELVHDHSLIAEGYPDSIRITSFDILFNYHGFLTKYPCAGDSISARAIADIGKFLVPNLITITNIQCEIKGKIKKIAATVTYTVMVPHNYIVMGYVKTVEFDSDTTSPKYNKNGTKVKLGFILFGDTLTVKDKKPAGRYIKLCGEKDPGYIVINIDSALSKDSMAHLPHIEVWGSIHPMPGVYGFGLNLSMNEGYVSQSSHFTKQMVNVLSKCKPGTEVMVSGIAYYGNRRSINSNDVMFTVEKLDDN